MAAVITAHQYGDLLYYLAFVGGQALFILKRSAQAIRSKSNPINSRRAYLESNWDVLLIRMAIEAPMFYLYRHYDVNSILAFFTSWRAPFAFPQGAMASFSLGYIADSLLDWFGTSKVAPDWLKENIPNVQVYAAHSVQSGVDSTGAPVTVEKTVTVEKLSTENPKP
jgi:hypothetical protein